MSKLKDEQKLTNTRAGARRRALVQSGAYDGRFRSRVVQPKKYKGEKYKKTVLEYGDSNY